MTIRRHQIMNCHGQLQCAKQRIAIFIAISLLVFSCAPNQPARNRDAMLPDVDVLQLKENGDIALRLAQECRASIDDLNTRVSALERTVAEMNSTIQSLPLAQMEEMQGQLTVLREELVLLRQSIAEKGAVVPTFNPAHKKPVPQVQVPAPEEYRNGLKAFEMKDWSDAISWFDQMVIKNSQSPWADDAWYWIGECYLRLGDYARAIDAFQKVFTYLQTDKGDDSQYMIGQCYVKMGDRQRAVAEYKKIEVLYPDSEYVIKAQAELRKLQSR